MRKQMNPTHADSLCIVPKSLAPFLWWMKGIRVKVMKKRLEHEMATTMNTGVGKAGAERTRFAALSGNLRMVRSVVWADIKLDGRAQWKM